MHQSSSQPFKQAAVSRLPAELITYIFILFRDELRADDKICNPYAFFVFTLVCRFWRDVVYVNPLVWTDITLPAPAALVIRALELSRSFPLDITISRSGMDQQLWSIIGGQLPRARRITLGTKDVAVTGSLVNTPAAFQGPSYELISQNILQSVRSAPALQSLDVVMYPGVWTDLAKLPSLQTLTIRHGEASPPVATSIGDITSGLGHLAQLEYFDIFCLVTVDLNAGAYFTFPKLPRLRRLNLTGSFWSTAAILAALDLPQSVRITAEQINMALSPSLNSSAGELLAASMDKLVGNEHICSLHFELERREMTLRAFTYESGPRFALKLPIDERTFEEFLGNLPLEHVTSVAVSNARSRSARLISDFMCESLDHISTLAVQNCDFQWLRMALTDEEDEEDEEDEQYPFPGLHTLEIVGHVFPMICEGRDCENCVHELEDILDLRSKALDAPLPELKLTGGYMSWSDRKRIIEPLVQAISIVRT